MRRIATAIAAAVIAAAALIPVVASAVEEPDYEVVSDYGDWEVRRYAPTIEARVTVSGDWDQAVSRGFRLLADYIFGGNLPQQKIAMTAPVAATGQSIAMTAPVASQQTVDASGAEQWEIAFTMPSEWTMETLPVPNDPRVVLVEVPSREVAVTRFNMKATDSRSQRKQAELMAAVESAGLTTLATPTIAQYNAPWTPPPLRRNEIMVPVRWTADAS